MFQMDIKTERKKVLLKCHTIYNNSHSVNIYNHNIKNAHLDENK
jgi:hypothetical protein